MVFVLAFFLDFFELAFIVIPLLRPVADKLGIDLIWFGVLLGVNMQTSFLHPPFGFALFYLRSVAPTESTIDRITGRLVAPGDDRADLLGRVPFVIMQLAMVGDGDRVSRHGAVVARQGPQDRSEQDPDRGAAGRAQGGNPADRVQIADQPASACPGAGGLRLFFDSM